MSEHRLTGTQLRSLADSPNLWLLNARGTAAALRELADLRESKPLEGFGTRRELLDWRRAKGESEMAGLGHPCLEPERRYRGMKIGQRLIEFSRGRTRPVVIDSMLAGRIGQRIIDGDTAVAELDAAKRTAAEDASERHELRRDLEAANLAVATAKAHAAPLAAEVDRLAGIIAAHGITPTNPPRYDLRHPIGTTNANAMRIAHGLPPIPTEREAQLQAERDQATRCATDLAAIVARLAGQ